MAYVCSVVSVISYPPKSLSIFLQGFDVNNVRAEADVNMYYTAKSCTVKWVNPHAYGLWAPPHWLNVIFVRSLMVPIYMISFVHLLVAFH